MEFEVTTDLSALPSVIESNAPEIRAEMDQKLEFYRNLVVTPETVNDGKQAKADLNKLKAAIADKRREVKRQCLDPYKAFEDACKEIEGMIDDAVESIDKQLKEFARQVATEKLNALQEYFGQIVTGGLGGNGSPLPGTTGGSEEAKPPANRSPHYDLSWIELGRILNPKWKNSTMKLDVLKKEIWETVFRMSEEAKELHQIYGGSPLYPAIWGKYLETYSKGETLAYAAVLIQQRRVAADEMPSNPQGTPYGCAPVAQSRAEGTQVTGSALITGMFRVTGTRAQIQALGTFIKQSGMKLEIIPEKKKEEKKNGSNE